MNNRSSAKLCMGLTAGLVGLTTASGLVLMSTKVSADDVVDNISITVPIACSMSGTIASGNEHTAEIANGTYQANIGTTSIKALCNDNAGFSIYAIGNSGDTLGEEDSTKLLGTSASGNAKIVTGTATTAGTPDVSNWAMKLATDSEASYPLTIESDTEGAFSSYHTVPAEYTKVATRLAGTDVGTSAEGATLTTTYATYISKTQAADTYTGKVKYVLVHPNDGTAPVIPTASTCNTPVPNLTYMQDLNSSNKSTVLASMTEDEQYFLKDARDEKTYCVAKLKDGNIWMTQNLDHDISTTYSYTNENTDIGWNGSSYTSTSWTAERATYTTGTTTWDDYNRISDQNGVNGYYHPESYDPGELYWNGTAAYYDNETDCVAAGGTWDDNNGLCNLIASSGDSHYHLGNYYNWSAAVATNDTSSYTTQYQDLDRSICPANWTLPKSGDNTFNGSFQYLVTQYGWDSSEYTMTNPNIWNTAIKSALAGGWYGSLEDVGYYGAWWSPVVGNSDLAYSLDADSDGGVGPVVGYGRGYGNLVRCIAR
ncbi:hypothetical protein IKF92_03660 [Candidatus Saccharibacteria bacterium]|nr:hypothetical protein [Candidatus Saccharibacteria bacterium]